MNRSKVGSWLVPSHKVPVHQRIGIGDIRADEQNIQTGCAANKRIGNLIVEPSFHQSDFGTALCKPNCESRSSSARSYNDIVVRGRHSQNGSKRPQSSRYKSSQLVKEPLEHVVGGLGRYDDCPGRQGEQPA